MSSVYGKIQVYKGVVSGKNRRGGKYCQNQSKVLGLLFNCKTTQPTTKKTTSFNMKVTVAAAILGSMLPVALGFCCGGDGSGICGDGSTQGAGCCGVGPCNIFCCNCDGGDGSMLLPVAISLPLPR